MNFPCWPHSGHGPIDLVSVHQNMSRSHNLRQSVWSYPYVISIAKRRSPILLFWLNLMEIVDAIHETCNVVYGEWVSHLEKCTGTLRPFQDSMISWVRSDSVLPISAVKSGVALYFINSIYLHLKENKETRSQYLTLLWIPQRTFHSFSHSTLTEYGSISCGGKCWDQTLQT